MSMKTETREKGGIKDVRFTFGQHFAKNEKCFRVFNEIPKTPHYLIRFVISVIS